MVECARCRLIRLSPQPTPQELQGYYPGEYWFEPGASLSAQLSDLYRSLVLYDHIRFVRRAIEKSGAQGLILDVGCGGGLFLRLLAPPRMPVAGLDLSRGAAAIAWRTNRVPAVNASLTAAPFPPGSCAAITMFHVLEHLYEPRLYLEAARELLHPEGRLIVQVPNAACWQFLLLGAHWNGVDVPRHLWNFRDADIEILLDRCGFEVLRRKYFSLRDNPAGLATSIAPGLDPMARRVRRVPESGALALLKDAAYFLLTVACAPMAVLEAACGAGSTFMVEARKKS